MRAVCLLVALAAVGLGVLGLAHLSAAYRASDIAHEETSVVFGLWLREEADRLEDAPERLADRIALRLSLQPIATRYRLVQGLLSEDYWRRLAADPRARAGLRRAVLAGTERALESAPSRGDLWLLASVLRTRAGGFDEKAASYLEASHVFARMELSVALSRLVFAVAMWPALPEDLRMQARLNAALIETVAPAESAGIRRLFAQAGIDPQ